MKFSIVIPHSMDYPHVWFTVQDKWMRLLENYEINDFEIIIVENGSVGVPLELVRRLGGRKGNNPKEWHSRENSWGPPKRLALTYIENERTLHPSRVTFPTQLHSKPACNMGAWKAKGEHLVFCDSHVLFNNDWFTLAEKTMDDNADCTILHSSLSWHMRNPHRRGYQYNLLFNEDGGRFWGNWSAAKVSDQPYTVAASGWASVVVRRKDYIERYKGFPSMLRAYGGGEPYMDILAWMMGDKVLLNPKMHTCHFSLAKSRGYHQGGPIIYARNIWLCTYILGGQLWLDRAYDDSMKKLAEKRKHLDWIPKYEEAYQQVLKWGKHRRKWVEDNAEYSLDEVCRLFDAEDVFH